MKAIKILISAFILFVVIGVSPDVKANDIGKKFTLIEKSDCIAIAVENEISDYSFNEVMPLSGVTHTEGRKRVAFERSYFDHYNYQERLKVAYNQNKWANRVILYNRKALLRT